MYLIWTPWRSTPRLNPLGLSPGDILASVPIGSTRLPIAFLPKEPYLNKQGRHLYTKYDELQEYPNEEGVGNWIAKGRIAMALVVSHDCDLDDGKDTERIVVAPVFPIARVTSSEEDRARIKEGGRATYVPLPGVPSAGDCCAELRSICPLDRGLFNASNRHCSMTEEAVFVYREQLIHYFTRLNPEKLEAALAADAAEQAEKEEKARAAD